MAEITLTFLGTGTSQGVPMIACNCEVCRSTDRRDKRSRSSVYVETPEASWVIDTGPDFREQCLREKVQRVDAAVYTHSHTDHIMGFDDLRPFCSLSQPLPIHGSAQTLLDLKRVFAFAFDGSARFAGYVHPEPIEFAGPFRIGNTELVPLALPHGRATVHGFLMRRNGKSLIAYLSDCKSVPEPALKLVKGVRCLIVDALRHRSHPTHMNIEEALATAAEVRPGETWFTHICHELPHAETERHLPRGVRIAYDGLKLTL
jgi:phosphoribosyl 1,2-cyclic phosphate phosphodiesterase